MPSHIVRMQAKKAAVVVSRYQPSAEFIAAEDFLILRNFRNQHTAAAD